MHRDRQDAPAATGPGPGADVPANSGQGDKMDAFLSSPPPFVGPRFDRLLQQLSESSHALEGTDAWPGKQFDELADAGVLQWSIPEEYGGLTLSPEQLMYGYERMATSCLTTTFVLTQRIGACQRIASSENDEVRQELLPALATGDLFATVGISHLTTSRQHLKQPAVRAEHADGKWILSGTVPWVTGGNRADVIVTGGTCEDGNQLLIALPTDLPGVTCQAPPKLLALNASQTGSVELDRVEVDERNLLAGPVEGVMNRGQGGGAGSVTTSALAVGLTGRAVEELQKEASRRDDLVETVDSLERERDQLRTDLYAVARGDAVGMFAGEIRQRANSLVLRATQAYLAASKGAGFVAGHPAERSVREAMFFLVWSCPQPVLQAALREFACSLDE
ncbi:Acyl-CoA dehydrogenase [Maioricimonas rarisocia]|uniref:Acyl-CoA dehydrogenase n=2 Tax=Maioricimonas rarisocia TaxID=2528026 RepID=A0A517Z523_9PLAN|nr:Acyl-CoA dehydrogenase [Maioricimonas rarisocia]